MPVSTIRSRRSPYTAAASRIVRSARGRRPPTSGSSVRRTVPSARDAQVVAAGGEQRDARGRSGRRARASRTVSGDARSSRSASEPVKPGGHVLDDHDAAAEVGRAAPGRARRAPAGRRSSRRSPSPACPPAAGGRAGEARERTEPPAAVAAARPGGATRAARWRLVVELAKNASGSVSRPGLATSSTAPSASASTARAPCAGENADTTTTATIGSAARSSFRTPMPSRPGMARSSDSTSGRCFAHSRERLVAVGGRPRRPPLPAP